MSNKYSLCLLSIGVLVTIILIGAVARKSLSIYGKTDVTTASNQIREYTYDTYIKEKYKLDDYLIYLQEYIRATKVTLNADDESRKELLLKKLATIAKLEKKSNIQHMSIDGREMAISLLKNIYGVYGVNILFGLDGEIQKVDDPLGNPIYLNAEKTLQIVCQLVYLAIIICINLILFVLSIFISKKNKIFVKGGDVYGIDKKKYA